MKRSKSILGFTLIEIMMVLLIFIVMISFITINANFSLNESAKIKAFSTNMLERIKLARQQALFKHEVLRLFIWGDNYGFQHLVQQQNNDMKWAWIENDSLLAKTPIDNNIQVELKEPIIFNPTGEMPIFSVQVSNKKQTIQYSIVSNDQGTLKVVQHE